MFNDDDDLDMNGLDDDELAELVDGVEQDVLAWIAAGPADPVQPSGITRISVWQEQVKHELAYEHRLQQGRALRAVAYALEMRRLAPAKGQPCQDCGKPADRYDHRDYSKPLMVAPVCASCNKLRGKAHTRLTPDQLERVKARAEERATRANFTHAVFIQQLEDSLALALERRRTNDRAAGKAEPLPDAQTP